MVLRLPTRSPDAGAAGRSWGRELRIFRRDGQKFLPRQLGFAAHVLHRLGDIATHPNPFDAESGETHYRQARTLAEQRGMRPLVAHCHLGLIGMEHSLRPAEEALATITWVLTGNAGIRSGHDLPAALAGVGCPG